MKLGGWDNIKWWRKGAFVIKVTDPQLAAGKFPFHVFFVLLHKTEISNAFLFHVLLVSKH